jgi:DNA-binding MarR family transcriptional regulator
LSSQVLRTQAPVEPHLEPWIRFLRAHASLTRQLSTRLEAEHGLTLRDFDVLAQLAYAPDRQLRRIDLARGVLLSPSGITRLLDGLERAGLVEKGTCASDARVTYAVLTEAGFEAFSAARRAHVRDVDALFTSRFEPHEREQLAELLGQLLDPGEDDPACTVEPE